MAFAPGQSTTEPEPLGFRSRQPEERNRLTAALRIIWVIPQFIVLWFVSIAAFFVAIYGWFGALFTGELPEFAEVFLAGVIRWGARVGGYAYFLTDDYPPYSLDADPNYPIEISVPQREPLNRLAVLFRIILVIPAYVVAGVAASGLGLLSVGSWAMITFTGAQPKPLYEATRAVIRFETRLAGYFWMLTAEYPWGLLGDEPVSGDSASEDSSWSLRLSEGGRNAVYVLLALGVLYVLYNYA